MAAKGTKRPSSDEIWTSAFADLLVMLLSQKNLKKYICEVISTAHVSCVSAPPSNMQDNQQMNERVDLTTCLWCHLNVSTLDSDRLIIAEKTWLFLVLKHSFQESNITQYRASASKPRLF